jgi:hypothetical protein
MQSKFVNPVENFTQTVVNPSRETKKAWETIKKDDLGISKSLEGVIAATSTPSADALKLHEHYVSLFRALLIETSLTLVYLKLERNQSLTRPLLHY